MDLMLKNKEYRVNKEKMVALETENAILHLQIAQLQNTLKSQLRRQNQSTAAVYCEHWFPRLLEKMKQLKHDVRSLQIEYKVHQQKIREMTSTALNSIARRYRIKVANFNDIQKKYEEEKAKRKELHNELVELRGNIRVYCRVRPLLQRDIDRDCTACIKCTDDETVCIEHHKPSYLGSRIAQKRFNFDKVYSPRDTQETVFADVKPLLTSLLDGYNVCIMAYGQTGGGKTYTMLGGEGGTRSDLSGVLPSATTQLFRLIDEKGMNCDISVTVIEIYNEKIRDLLSTKPGSSHHDVIFEQNGEVEVTNLTERVVSSEGELLCLVCEGMKHRATHCTNVHEHSSRSHLIVTLHVTITGGEECCSVRSSGSSLQLNTTITPVTSNDSTPVVSPSSSPPGQSESQCTSRFSSWSSVTDSRRSTSLTVRRPSTTTLSHVKLQLVDLAGSECVGQSGVCGTHLKETQHINKSLCALSDVLTALADKRAHIPYRNSTLTHILQDSIGGKAKMLMYLCLSPTSGHCVESLRVLSFGGRARQVQRPPPSPVPNKPSL